MKDKCVVCKEDSVYDLDENIICRLAYIIGVGQLCFECYDEIYFNTGINKYFPKGKSCELCVDFLEENYMEKLVCNGIDVNDGHKIKMRMLGLL